MSCWSFSSNNIACSVRSGKILGTNCFYYLSASSWEDTMVLIMDYGENEWNERCGVILMFSSFLWVWQDTLQTMTHVSKVATSFSWKLSEAPWQIRTPILHLKRRRNIKVKFAVYFMQNCSKKLYSIDSRIIDYALKTALHVIKFEQQSGLHPFSREHTNRTAMQPIYNRTSVYSCEWSVSVLRVYEYRASE